MLHELENKALMNPNDLPSLLDDSRREERKAWLTVKEYAAYKRVHAQTVRKWIKLGFVKAEKDHPTPKGRWRIKAPQRAA